MTTLISQEDCWDGYEPLPIGQLQQRYHRFLQHRVHRLEECKTVRSRDYYGEGYQEKWQFDTAQKRYVNRSTYGMRFYYNLFGNGYQLEGGERKVGKGMCIDNLFVASIYGKIHAFVGGGHQCRSGGKIGYPEFRINVEEPRTLFQRLREIPTSFDLVTRNKKAIKYGLLIGQEIPEKKEDTERVAWCEQMWRKGWMFNAEEDKDKQERFKRCDELVPTVEYVLKYYVRIK